MKRYLFTRELFRSRIIAAYHLAVFASLFWTKGWLWLFPLLFWAFVTAYNVYARWKEFRFSWSATLRYLEAQRAVNESALDTGSDEASLGYCFDCAAEGLQIDAQFLVAAGPHGEKKPVCMIHARAQALQNAKDADKPKEVAA
jgi:hypothetical protein